MAEAFLQLLLNNLSSLIQNEIGTIMGVDDEMKKLVSTLTTIQAVLEDAELRQDESKAMRDWLSKLQDLTYEIDDILDECSTEVEKLQHKGRKSSRYNLKNILYQRKIGRRMKEVTKKLDVVAQERTKFHLREMPIEKQSKVAFTRETSSILNEPDHVYGRDKEKEGIVDILVNQVKDCQQLSVLPIIGIGGLGKTTLAQLVFNDSRVTEHFDTKIWVCVSDNFDLKTLIKAIIECRSPNDSHLECLESLNQRLRELLDQKKYLIVLDDVWNEDQEKWFKLKTILACGSPGASILLTTRLKKVAEIMLTLPAHNLGGLSNEDCWKLLKQRALGQEEELHTNLESIGKQIVKKCAGVPLAAKTIGSLLRFNRDEREWIHIKESEFWNLPQDETHILPALKLSYHHLPLHLRQCFAYCAVYPKDARIDKQNLILMWIAHGYILSNKQKDEEDVGDEIWNELVWRSFFQDVVYSSDGVSCVMHDLVHDLAQSILENKVNGAQQERHTGSARNNKIRKVDLRKRTVAFPISSLTDIDLSSVIRKFSRLRSLNASCVIEDLPFIISHLKHLRHLDLSSTHVSTLPKAICSLWNLKILNLTSCNKLVRLPKNMRDMHNLRHVLLEDCSSLSEIPPNISQLTYLKNWSMFIVGHGKGYQVEELQRLNLGGRLEIKHLERVKSHVDAKKANLVEKRNLHSLSLDWASSGLVEIGDENILEALEPHRNLKNLTIIGFKGKKFPFWMENSALENMVQLSIIKCPNIWLLPQVLGDLPRLQYLRLESLAIEYITEDEAAVGVVPLKPKFPSVKRLTLDDLPNLKGLRKEETRQVHMFPNVWMLDIFGCPSLRIFQEMSSVTVLYFANSNILILTAISTMFENLGFLSIITDREPTNIFHGGFENITMKLKSLEIMGARDLFLPEEEYLMRVALQSLDKLVIKGNKTMRCLPEMWMPNLIALQSLSIFNCPEFIELPDGIKYHGNLTSITFHNLPKMKRLPEALRFLPSLKSLYLLRLTQLASLPDWFAELIHLDWLAIHNCQKLVSLPDCVQEMKSIQHLDIVSCPELERRCEKGKGEDWYKIQHIPRVQIDGYYV